MSGPRQPRLSRRTTLKWIGAFAASGVSPSGIAAARGVVGFDPTPTGYGSDPNLVDPTVPWPLTMTKRELELTAVISDLILPPTATAPAPSAIGVPDYLDEWVSAPYADQRGDRALMLSGLAWLDAEAARRWQHGFVEATDPERRQILDEILVGGASAAAKWHEFFFRLRFLVVAAYYSTRPGFEDIGYIGNVALERFPAPSDAEITILEEELRKLGL